MGERNKTEREKGKVILADKDVEGTLPRLSIISPPLGIN